MVIDKNSVIVIKKSDFENIGFLPIDEELYKEIDEATELFYKNKIKIVDFKEKYKYHPLAFLLYGETDIVNSNLISKYIDCVDLKEGERSVTSYKCFCGHKFGLDYKTTILHRSALDSWRCLLASTNNPKFAVIINLNYI